MPELGAPGFDASASSSQDPIIESPDTSDSPETDLPQEDANPFKGTKHKIKAKGKELELDYEEVLKRAEKAEGADLVFKEAAEVRKQMKELETKLGRLSKSDEDNFLEMIETIGWEKAQKFANTLVKKQLEWEELSDAEQNQILRQQEAEEAKAELESYKSKEQKLKAEQDHSIAMELVDKEVGEALAFAKENGLSIAEAPHFAERVVDELLAYLEYVEKEEEAGRPITMAPPTPVDVARKLQGLNDESTKGFLKKLDAKALRSMLTPEQLDALRQSEIDDLYSPTPRMTSKPKAEDTINPFESKSTKPKSTKNFFAAMDDHFGVKR